MYRRSWIVLAATLTIGLTISVMVTQESRTHVEGLPPWPLWRFYTGFQTALSKLKRMIDPPHVNAMELGSAFWKTMITTTICKLRIPDLLHDHPMTCEELSVAISKDSNRAVYTPYLCRLLRAGSQLGIVEESRRMFYTTALGRQLEERDDSMRAIVLMLSDISLDGWLQLTESIHTGEGGFNLAHGETIWEFNSREENRAHAALFDKAMTSTTVSFPTGASVAVEYDKWRTCKKICDVGGGRGQLLADLLDHYPNATGVVMDLPGVAERAREYLTSRGFEPPRAIAKAADFTLPLSERCDCYTLKTIAHDWNDTVVVQILKNIKSVMEDGGRVFIIDSVLSDSYRYGYVEEIKVMVDINMMASCAAGAQERTLKQFQHVASEAGFRINRHIEMRGLDDLLELVQA